MNLNELRTFLHQYMVSMKDSVTHGEIAGLCKALGLAEPPSADQEVKADRLSLAVATTPEHKLPTVADSILDLRPMHPKDRNKLQDILWQDSWPILKRYRREIAGALDIESLFKDASKFDQLVESLFVLERDLNISEIFGGNSKKSLRDEIQQHIHRNPGDWDVEYFFNQIGAIDCSDKRFALFLEGLAGPEVIPDEHSQRMFVERVNAPLSKCGLEFRELSTKDGYPVFELVSIHTASSDRPKNLIFASRVKPDLRFNDAVSNNIEIVTGADHVLIYDRPISADGICWFDLQMWWKDLHRIGDDDDAKQTLYRRLRESLPDSPPQQLFFSSYHKTFGEEIPILPALLPEVWLHWDPQTVKQRGTKALTRSRMDFLMLMPAGIRVVLEIDGKQHYSKGDRPDPGLYGKMVAADRQLKLDGYHVYRFGGAELQGAQGELIVGDFFRALFARFGIQHADRPN